MHPFSDIIDDVNEFASKDQDRSTGLVRLAVIGLGNFSRNVVLPALADCSLIEPTVLVTGSPEKAEQVAVEHDVDQTISYSEFENGAHVERYDAVYISTPNGTHQRFTEAAAKLGKHVLCEKPIATDTATAEAMVETCTVNGVTLMMGYRSQFDPAIRLGRELIDSGAIGTPVQLFSSFSSPIVDRYGDDQWRLSADMSGGGPVINLGIYHINTLRFLLDADPTAVQASTTAQRTAFSEVEEHAGYTFTYSTGAIATCTTSFNAFRENTLRIVGKDGMVAIDPAYEVNTERTITVRSDDWHLEYETPAVNEITREFAHFATCLLDGKSPISDGSQGVDDVAIVEAIHESSTTGTSIDI